MTSPTVAALYVDPNGAYANLPGVEVWDEARDARTYAGPWPVVAHPPCSRWCALAGLVESRYGYRRGDDGGTFAAALAAVRTYGGVLEHPAYSAAWRAFGLPEPRSDTGWTTSLFDAGATAYVEQHFYGHPARKATWLYAFGIELPLIEGGATDRRRWQGPVVSRAHSKERGPADRVRLRSAESSRSPIAFRDVLLAMARSAASSGIEVYA